MQQEALHRCLPSFNAGLLVAKENLMLWFLMASKWFSNYSQARCQNASRTQRNGSCRGEPSVVRESLWPLHRQGMRTQSRRIL